MPTLAPKLPWQHAFAGGYPRRGGQALPTDPDAIDYLNRVAAADGASVEVGIAQAIDAFVRGCKADGTWDAIQASCIMCGARTLSGALVPLKTPYGSELVDINALPTPTVANSGGSSGLWDAQTRTLSFISPAVSFPRMAFDIPLTSGKRYYVVGRLSGSLTAVNRIRLSVSLTTSDIAYNSATGVFEGRANADGTKLEFVIQGNGTEQSVTIESLSIREDSFTPTALGSWASGDYSRSGATPGLKGDGTTKYLDTNRASDADGQNDRHVSVYQTSATSAAKFLIGTSPSGVRSNLVVVGPSGGTLDVTLSSSTNKANAGMYANGLLGGARDGATSVVSRGNGTTVTSSETSGTPTSNNYHVFASQGSTASRFDGRLAFYSLGAALDLAALDTRVSNLVTAIRFHTLTGLLPNDYDPATIAYIVSGISAGGTL